jgi:Flp pilus assembly protein TadG
MGANVAGVIPSALRRGAVRRSLWRDRGGAAGIYVAVVSAAMVGMAGLALDLGRLWTINTQAQDAADAAALAAASQLDGSGTATTRAYNAATTTALVQNQQALSGTGGTVTIQTVDFLAALPNSDATPITAANILCSGTACTAAQSAQVNFVRVTTQQLPHQNLILSAFGAPNSSGTSASAVAGNTKIMCQPTPVFVCNPQGNGSGFDITQWQGKQVKLTQGGGGNGQWGPGNYGLLNPINCQGSTSCLAQQLASTPSGAACISSVTTQPGNVTPVNAAINTRFDIWFPPGFKDPTSVPASQLPARDVVKGLVPQTLGSGNKVDCSKFAPPAGAVQALPRDNLFTGQNSAFGNGQWNCQQYWTVNHGPGTGAQLAQPPWCTTATDATANFPDQTRFAVYKQELNTANTIPDNHQLSPAGEDGRIPEAPNACASSTWQVPQGCSGGDPDLCTIANRRLLWFAIIDCATNPINGTSGPIDPLAFVKGFITEPVGYVPGQQLNSSANQDIYVEFAGEAESGGGLLHHIVQLYR